MLIWEMNSKKILASGTNKIQKRNFWEQKEVQKIEPLEI
jgi:hypothetical protein